MRAVRGRLTGALAVALAATVTQAAEQASQSASGWPAAIEDNSFLIEEAYNQEPGVVQLITTGFWDRAAKEWATSVTNEWPVPGQRHQLSFTLPYTLARHGRSGAGDLMLNYRYQLRDGSSDGLAIAPRLSVILPVGNRQKQLGRGVTAYQANLPASWRFAPDLVCHFNIGGSYYPGVESATARGGRVDLWGRFGGASVIWLATSRLNAMLEGFVVEDQEPNGSGKAWSRQAFLSPGVRRAFDFRAGQLVLGAAMPIGLSKDSPSTSAFLYVSWEAPVWQP